MKKIVLLFFVVFSLSLYAQEVGIRFGNDSLLSDALARSKKGGKLVFIDCYATWCGYCKSLSKEIFTQKKVGDFYNSHFINLAFDIEKGDGIKIRAKYGVTGLPTLLFLNAEGETVHVGDGPFDADSLIESGKIAMDDTRNLLSIAKRIKAGDKSIQTLMFYLKNNNYTADKEALVNDYFKTATDEEKLSKDAWYLFDNYIHDIDNDQFQYFLKHRNAYEQKFGKNDVDSKIMSEFTFYQQQYGDDPQKAASVKSIDPALYAKYILRNYIETVAGEQQFQKDDKGRWDNYLTKAKKVISLDSIEPVVINYICLNIYENYRTFNDTASLRLAKDWQEKVQKAHPNNVSIDDTYAHILFELGNVKEAVKYEELAIKIATELNRTRDLKLYNAEVEKFRKKLPLFEM